MPWKQRALSNLERENAGLRSEIVKLRSELRTKQTQLGGLELALVQRLETIDQLNAKLDALRLKNKQLDEEAEHWCQLIAASHLTAQQA